MKVVSGSLASLLVAGALTVSIPLKKYSREEVVEKITAPRIRDNDFNDYTILTKSGRVYTASEKEYEALNIKVGERYKISGRESLVDGLWKTANYLKISKN